MNSESYTEMLRVAVEIVKTKEPPEDWSLVTEAISNLLVIIDELADMK